MGLKPGSNRPSESLSLWISLSLSLSLSLAPSLSCMHMTHTHTHTYTTLTHTHTHIRTLHWHTRAHTHTHTHTVTHWHTCEHAYTAATGWPTRGYWYSTRCPTLSLFYAFGVSCLRPEQISCIHLTFLSWSCVCSLCSVPVVSRYSVIFPTPTVIMISYSHYIHWTI